jgi:hypothetical protein
MYDKVHGSHRHRGTLLSFYQASRKWTRIRWLIWKIHIGN